VADYENTYFYSSGCRDGDDSHLDFVPYSDVSKLYNNPGYNPSTYYCPFRPVARDVWEHYGLNPSP